MSREPLPCPHHQMRDGGTPPTHLSTASLERALLGPRHWLAPPERAPDRDAPDRASYVAAYGMAQFNGVILDRAVQLLQARLSHLAEHDELIQRVETARSAALAKWRRQEDAAIAMALAEEDAMHRRFCETLRLITEDAYIKLDSLVLPSSNLTDDASALLATKHDADVAVTQRHNDEVATNFTRDALRRAEARATALAASRRQEDDTRHQAFTSAATTRRNSVAAIQKALSAYERARGDYDAWEIVERARWLAHTDPPRTAAPLNAIATVVDTSSATSTATADMAIGSATLECAPIPAAPTPIANSDDAAGGAIAKAVALAIERPWVDCALRATPLDATTNVDKLDADQQETSPLPSEEASPSPRPTSYLSAVLSTAPFGGSPAARTLPQATTSTARPSTPVDHVAVARRARPRRRTGRRNRPRAPSPPDEGLPSHPIQQQGGALKPTPTALARATLLPSRSAVSHQLTTPPPPTLLPHNTAGVDVGVLAMSSGGGGAHPFLERGPTPPRQRKRTRRKRRPLRVCRRHGPRAPDHADSLLLGRRHRPRAPNQSTRNGWA